jgi:hypothetical protein
VCPILSKFVARCSIVCYNYIEVGRNKVKIYHGTNYSSAINIMTNGIDLKYSKKYLDFGIGFYTTPSYDHAAFSAIRATDKFNKRYGKSEEPYIVTMDFALKRDLELSVKQLVRHSDSWGRFVLNNRLTGDILDAYGINEHNQDGRYDICYGEIADGNIANIAYQVNIGKKLPEDVDYHEFLKKKGKDYPQQYSFHTAEAFSCITLLSCDIIINKQKYLKLIERG